MPGGTPLGQRAEPDLHPAPIAAMSSLVDNSTPNELLDLVAPEGIGLGEYLLEELRDGRRVLWRISEGAPADGVLAGHGCLLSRCR